MRPPWRATTTHRSPSSDLSRPGAGVEGSVPNLPVNDQVGKDRLSAIIEQRVFQAFPLPRAVEAEQQETSISDHKDFRRARIRHHRSVFLKGIR